MVHSSRTDDRQTVAASEKDRTVERDWFDSTLQAGGSDLARAA